MSCVDCTCPCFNTDFKCIDQCQCSNCSNDKLPESKESIFEPAPPPNENFPKVDHFNPSILKKPKESQQISQTEADNSSDTAEASAMAIHVNLPVHVLTSINSLKGPEQYFQGDVRPKSKKRVQLDVGCDCGKYGCKRQQCDCFDAGALCNDKCTCNKCNNSPKASEINELTTSI